MAKNYFEMIPIDLVYLIIGKHVFTEDFSYSNIVPLFIETFSFLIDEVHLSRIFADPKNIIHLFRNIMRCGLFDTFYAILDEWSKLPDILSSNMDNLHEFMSSVIFFIGDINMFKFVNERIGYKLQKGDLSELYIKCMKEGPMCDTIIPLEIFDYVSSLGYSNTLMIIEASKLLPFVNLQPSIEKYGVKLSPERLVYIFEHEIQEDKENLLKLFMKKYKTSEFIDLLLRKIIDLIRNNRLDKEDALRLLKLNNFE